MKEDNLITFNSPDNGHVDRQTDALTELIRQGAKQLIQQAVEAELANYMSQFAESKLSNGCSAVVRNGYHPSRQLQTGIGDVEVKVPKIRSKDSAINACFHSSLVPPYLRKTKTMEATIPWLYLKGISTGDMSEALSALLGHDALGLSASTVSRLKQQWQQDYQAFRQSEITDSFAYLWVDGIYSTIRGKDNAKLCALVVIGVNQEGEKRLLAIEDGVRESTQSWKEVLLSLKSRGLTAPKLAIGDGALGFWSALEDIFSTTKQQRCWVHKIANVLNKLPKKAQPKAKQALQQIYLSATKSDALDALQLFINQYDDKYPKTTQCLLKDKDNLLSFYDFPAKHWQSIRTTNPIESTFATIRHRTKRSKGCLSTIGMLTMMFKLGLTAQNNWRRLRGYDEIKNLLNGTIYIDGINQSKQQAA